MTEKTKRIILIAAGVLLCAALVVGIVSRLAAVPMPIDPAIATMVDAGEIESVDTAALTELADFIEKGE